MVARILRQVEANVIIYSRNKLDQTTYIQVLFSSAQYLCTFITISVSQLCCSTSLPKLKSKYTYQSKMGSTNQICCLITSRQDVHGEPKSVEVREAIFQPGRQVRK